MRGGRGMESGNRKGEPHLRMRYGLGSKMDTKRRGYGGRGENTVCIDEGYRGS